MSRQTGENSPVTALRPQSARLSAALPATVIALGTASLFTDLSSEMIYPLLPAFLTAALGAGPMALGLIEGVAETTASVLKLFSGFLTDRWRRRKPIVLAGYSLSGLARPLICLATSWPWVLALRFSDRVGKGLRTSPRDALIADATPAERRGTAYGFHRAMDHAGAVVGPLAAMGLLAAGVSIRHVIALAAVPAAIVIVVLFVAVKEQRPEEMVLKPATLAFHSLWKSSGRGFRALMISLLIFNLGNSTDAFFLLRLGDAGMSPTTVALLWSAFHVVKMALSWVGGRTSDRFGPRSAIIIGWIVYSAIYAAFAVAHSPAALASAFLAYGIYHGMAEPAEKTLVAASAPPDLRGTAFALYHGAIGIAALPASVIFGAVWARFGTAAAFGMGSVLAAAALALLIASSTGALRATHSP